jgi:Amt family ammonium transporter
MLANSPGLNIGNTSFMLVCSALVMLMTPGLAFFYGGLVTKKNVLTVMLQSFASLCLTTILWFCIGYSMCFGPTWHGLIGDPTHFAFLKGVGLTTIYAGNGAGIPVGVHVVYQMMFAIIAPALISGAFANRVNFSAYLLFLTAWLIFVYFPFVHMIWNPDGLLSNMGVLDFAGGIVVHTTAGFSALASVIFIGRRCDSTDTPHNIPLMALGAGLLWFGWFGFNAGSEIGVDWVTVSSFVNTQLGAAFAGFTWFVLEWANLRRPNFVGLLTGAVAGLAAITPAAAYVSFAAAPVFGVLAGIVCYYAVTVKKVTGWDDALDVWGVHGVGGALGTILLGIFAGTSWNLHGVAGLLSGGTRFFLWQCVAVVASAAWAFAFTYAALWLINLVISVRVDSEAEKLGLDVSLLGEAAYSEDRWDRAQPT